MHPAFQKVHRRDIRTVRMVLYFVVFQISLRFVQIGKHLCIDLFHRIDRIILVFHIFRQFDRYCRRSQIPGTIRFPVKVRQSEIIESPEETGFSLDAFLLQLFLRVVCRQFIGGNQHHVTDVDAGIYLFPIPVLRSPGIPFIGKPHALLPSVPTEHSG